MNRNSIFAMISAAAMLAAGACTQDRLQVGGDEYISLSLSSRTMETKSTAEGEGTYNENAVGTLHYFFYRSGQTDAAPVIHGSFKDLGHDGGTTTKLIPVSSQAVSDLFGTAGECGVFIVANPPQALGTFLEGGPTLGELRAGTLVTELDGIQDSFTMVYDASANQTGTTGEIMTVNAKLKRLADKFTISLDVNGSYDDGSTEWQSVPADAKVEFHNAFGKTNLSADFDAVKDGDSNYADNYFTTETIGFTAPVSSGDKWTCKSERPVYTYPMRWDFAGSREPYLLIELPWKNTVSGEVMNSYYKVFLSTKYLESNDWYHLTVNLDRLGGFSKEAPSQPFVNMVYVVLDWNDAYESEDGLVSDVDDARFLMMNQTEYWLYNQESWNFPYTSSHDCKIVMETYSKMNYRARNSVTVTGDCSELGEDYSCSADGSIITFYHKLNNDITSNVFDGDIHYGDYDVVPYHFKFTICHKDKENEYRQEVIVHQYPAIYIEAQPNSAGVDLFTEGVRPTAFVHINSELIDDAVGAVITPSPYYSFYQYYGFGGDPQDISSLTLGNSNGNMYVVTTTTAPDLEVNGKAYMLADPRQFSISVPSDYPTDPLPGIQSEYSGGSYTEVIWKKPFDGENIFVDEHQPVQVLYGKSDRSLEYYYPTRNTADAENMIAPKLRVASSWGQASNMCYEMAVRRCAAYQEDGYPAGRWRMPTAAEIMYICKLSSDHMIPQLFGQFSARREDMYTYWCSTGLVGVYKAENSDGSFVDTFAPPEYIPGPENATERTAVRCVYDEWYWENMDYDNGNVKTTKGRLPASLWATRYWGDMPR